MDSPYFANLVWKRRVALQTLCQFRNRLFPDVDKVVGDHAETLLFAVIPSALQKLTRRMLETDNQDRTAFLLSIFRFVRLLLSGHEAVAIENVAPAAPNSPPFGGKRKRLILTTIDRVFRISLRR